MSDAITFRAAETAPVSEQASQTHDADRNEFRADSKAGDLPVPPSLSQAVDSKPYAMKHLGLELYADDADFAEMHAQAETLDKFVLEQIRARGLKDNDASYKEVINAIYKHIDKSPNEEPMKALKRLSVAASAIQRLEAAKLPPALSAKNLTASEYEEVHA